MHTAIVKSAYDKEERKTRYVTKSTAADQSQICNLLCHGTNHRHRIVKSSFKPKIPIHSC